MKQLAGQHFCSLSALLILVRVKLERHLAVCLSLIEGRGEVFTRGETSCGAPGDGDAVLMPRSDHLGCLSAASLPLVRNEMSSITKE